MGISALTLGAIMGGSSLASGLIGGITESNQRKAQADAQEAQARNLRATAKIQEEQGEIQAQARDKQRAQLRREYTTATGRNNTLLSLGNVDLTSGSALAQAEGNAAAFAGDLSENAYQRAIDLWENKNRVASTLAQADALEAQASRAKSVSAFPSLLNAALSATGSFLSGYSMAGGKIGKR